MITLRGPTFVPAGTQVTLTAMNVGPGFAAKADSKFGNVKLKVTVDPITHTATIRFNAPPRGCFVTIHVADSSPNEGTDHTVGSR